MHVLHVCAHAVQFTIRSMALTCSYMPSIITTCTCMWWYCAHTYYKHGQYGQFLVFLLLLSDTNRNSENSEFHIHVCATLLWLATHNYSICTVTSVIYDIIKGQAFTLNGTNAIIYGFNITERLQHACSHCSCLEPAILSASLVLTSLAHCVNVLLLLSLYWHANSVYLYLHV